MNQIAVIFLFIISFFTSPVFALEIPEKPQSYVNDYAALLSAQAKQRLETTLSTFQTETSNQVVVAVFNSLENQSLEDFSIRLAQKWKVGTKQNDNGVILVIFKQDRAVRLEVGYGLEGALPDALSKRIIQNEIIPNFRAGDFDAGVIKAVDAIILATRGEYKADGSLTGTKMDKWGGWIYLGMILYFIIPYVFYAVVLFLCVQFFGPLGIFAGIFLVLLLEGLRRIFSLAAGGTTFTGQGPRRGGWHGGGFGGGFGGGGFSGGGGSFGGGGASGRW